VYLMAQMPAKTSVWVTNGRVWLPAEQSIQPPTVVAYTAATMFVLNGRAIDALHRGLSEKEFAALREKFPDAVVSHGKEFELPLVPVGTVIDLTRDKPVTPSHVVGPTQAVPAERIKKPE